MLLILADLEIGARRGMQTFLNSKIHGINLLFKRREVKTQTY